MELNEIDNQIEVLINKMAELQNDNGSFDTLISLFASDIKWIHWNQSEPPPGETSFVMFPLLFIQSEKAKEIINKGKVYLLKNNSNKFIWKYSDSSTLNIKMAYDLDTTAFCSYFLSKTGMEIHNKKFINRFINESNYYKTFLLTKKPCNINFFIFLKLFYNNKKSNIFKGIKPVAFKDDWENGLTYNVLLHTGQTKENEHVWENLKKDFEEMNFKKTHYSGFFNLYAYARLCHYEKHEELIPQEEVLNNILDLIYNELDIRDATLNYLFFANALLFFDVQTKDFKNLFNYIFDNIRNGEVCKIKTYYTGHPHFPGSYDKNSHFGSQSMTCSLYLEFLNLYRKRVYGRYYGEK